MLDSRSRTLRPFFLLCFAFGGLAFPHSADAACNEPPDPAYRMTSGYVGGSGTISSPFLIPGTLAGDTTKRTITISANSGSAFGPVSGDVLTVAIQGSSPQVAAVFAANCNAVTACNPAVPCHNVSSLSFAASPTASVTFETSDVLKKLTRTGPVRLAVTPPTSVPCTLATLPCPAVSATMHACIDGNFNTGAPANYDIESATALPDPNEFWKFCKSSGQGSECNKAAGSIRYTIDSRGDILVPFDWAKLIKKQGGGPCKEGDSCDLRKVFAGTTLYSGIASDPIIEISCPESETYLQSFSAAGTSFSPGPLFQVDPNVGTEPETRLLGSIDKAFSVLRVRRCPQSDANCAAPKFTLALGTADYLEISVPAGKTGTCSIGGNPCSNNGECSGGSRCIWFDGEDRGPLSSQPSPSCDLMQDEDTGSGYWVLIVIILGGLLLVIWVFRKK